jgi:hypothetical protein
MALTDAEAVAYDAMLKHIRLRDLPKHFANRCLCGWIGAMHTKHQAHEVIEALKSRQMILEE